MCSLLVWLHNDGVIQRFSVPTAGLIYADSKLIGYDAVKTLET